VRENVRTAVLNISADTMKVFSTSLLALIAAAMVLAPFAYAQDVENENLFEVTAVGLPFAGLGSAKAIDTITTGETDTFSRYVWPLTSSLMVDANWGDPSDSLALTINAPDRTLGPYYDNSDGIVDGRILLRISNPSGYLPMGNWKFSVYGSHVTGVEDYSFVAY
jgi:hypothetical protein